MKETQEPTQQEYLRAAKEALSAIYPRLTWDRFAEKAGIEPRAFKTYRMPADSNDYRTLPRLARNAIEALLKTANKGRKKSP